MQFIKNYQTTSFTGDIHTKLPFSTDIPKKRYLKNKKRVISPVENAIVKLEPETQDDFVIQVTHCKVVIYVL